MLELPREIREHLERGGTVVVPTRARAAALRWAHSAAMLAAGGTVWNTPDILPWSAWVERGLEQARARGEAVPRRLSHLNEWLLWREAVREAAGASVLAPDGLVDAVRQAVAILEEEGLGCPAATTAEAALLHASDAYYRRRCQEARVLGAGSWQQCAPFLRPSAQLLLAGFQWIGAARRSWLKQHGARLAGGELPERAPAALQIVALADPAAEADAAADWSAQQLRADPAARLLLIVPRLSEQRHLWQRSLSQRLSYRAVLYPDASAPASPPVFAIEGGRSLSSHPLVATALNLVTLAMGPVRFEQLSALLRSPYWAAAQRAARLRLEVWLREQGIEAEGLESLEGLLGPIEQATGEGASDAVRVWVRNLAALIPRSCLSQLRPSQHWAELFAAWLAVCGWPGEALGAEELAVRVRFDELLGELAAADDKTTGGSAQLRLAEANALLQQLASRAACEPLGDDIAVTVTASLEDPIVHYDGVWIAGLAAEAWPPPVRPDPLLPLLLQRQIGLPASSADGQLQRAQQLLAAWRRTSRQCVVSWPSSDQDLHCQPSPLLAAHVKDSAVFTAGAQGAAPPGFAAEPWLAQLAPDLVAVSGGDSRPWPQSRPLRGGTRLLELQALCPFRGFAELRLGARELPVPEPGLDRRQRGQVLHRALELFWRDTGDSATLQRRTHADLLQLAGECSARAIKELGAVRPLGLQAWLLARERERTYQLLARLIEWDRARAPFRTEVLEGKQALTLVEGTLQLRLDRVDRLEDGRLLVIDYKSGQPLPFEADTQRPVQPQLPAYATALGGDVGAVLALYLGREGLTVKGIADRADRIRDLPAPPGGSAEWSQLLGRWRERLAGLVREFLDGHALIAPQAGACDRCHLHTLCRIDAAQLEWLRESALKAPAPAPNGLTGVTAGSSEDDA